MKTRSMDGATHFRATLGSDPSARADSRPGPYAPEAKSSQPAPVERPVRVFTWDIERQRWIIRRPQVWQARMKDHLAETVQWDFWENHR